MNTEAVDFSLIGILSFISVSLRLGFLFKLRTWMRGSKHTRSVRAGAMAFKSHLSSPTPRPLWPNQQLPLLLICPLGSYLYEGRNPAFKQACQLILVYLHMTVSIKQCTHNLHDCCGVGHVSGPGFQALDARFQDLDIRTWVSGPRKLSILRSSYLFPVTFLCVHRHFSFSRHFSLRPVVTDGRTDGLRESYI